MSVPETTVESKKSKSRKRDAEAAELEVDVNAPEPPSKKALRKAKKAKSSGETPSAPVVDAKAVEEASKRSEYGVWIGNLSFNTTKDDLTTFLTQSAGSSVRQNQITRVHLPQGQPKFGKPQSKGFAYVDFSAAECITAAIELSESVLGGRRVLIKNAKSFEGRPEQKKDTAPISTRPPNKKIFVGNLDWTTTQEGLESHFSACGTVVYSHMATFEDSGKCKGYAWVEFEDLTSAESAVRGWTDAQGEETEANPRGRKGGKKWVNNLQGRKLNIDFAEDKATRYEKRYGKNARKPAPAAEHDVDEEEGGVNIKKEAKAETRSRQRAETTERKRADGKYSSETVQRLTGAIVEAKGNRTKFE